MRTQLFRYFVVVLALVGLTGCLYGQCMNGPCALSRAEYIQSIKSYIQHWEKSGVDPTVRRQDSLQCGTASTEFAMDNVVFDAAVQTAAMLPGETTDSAARTRLRHRWERCMLNKGYEFTGPCYDNDISRAKPACEKFFGRKVP